MSLQFKTKFVWYFKLNKEYEIGKEFKNSILH